MTATRAVAGMTTKRAVAGRTETRAVAGRTAKRAVAGRTDKGRPPEWRQCAVVPEERLSPRRSEVKRGRGKESAERRA
jgi:hypothetical protein